MLSVPPNLMVSSSSSATVMLFSWKKECLFFCGLHLYSCNTYGMVNSSLYHGLARPKPWLMRDDGCWLKGSTLDIVVFLVISWDSPPQVRWYNRTSVPCNLNTVFLSVFCGLHLYLLICCHKQATYGAQREILIRRSKNKRMNYKHLKS